MASAAAGAEEGVDEGVVDPCPHAGLAGVVGEATVRGAADRPVGGPNDREGRVDLGERPVGRGRHVGGGAREPAQRVLAIGGVVADAGGHLGVGGLHEEGADAADERRGVAHEPPGDRPGTEQPRIAEVVEGVRQRIRCVAEESGGGLGDAFPPAGAHRRRSGFTAVG